MKSLKPGGILNADMFAEHPDQWADWLHQLYERKGITDPAQQKSWNAQIFRRGTTTQAMNTLMFQSDRLRRGASGITETWNVQNAAQDLLGNNLHTSIDRFHNSWSNLLTALGSPLVAPATEAMKSISESMNVFTTFAKSNPETIKAIGVGLTAIGAVFIGAGAAAMLGALGPAGWFTVGLSGISASIVTMPKSIWTSLGDGLSLIGRKANDLLVFLQLWGERFGNWLNSLRDRLINGLSGLWQSFTGLFSKTGYGGGGGGGSIISAAYHPGGGGDIVSLGRRLQGMGLMVSEHPAFGGVHPVHHGRGHYEGRAIDVNMGRGIVEANNPFAGARFDALARSLRSEGYKVIWRAPGHYNHMHVESPRGGVNFSPPTRSEVRASVPTVVLEVDGRMLGRAASEHIARHHEHTRQAPYFNGRGMFAGNDTQFAT